MLLLLLAGSLAGQAQAPSDITAPANLTVYRIGSKWVELMWAPSQRGPIYAPSYYKVYINGVWDGVRVNSVYTASTMSSEKLTLTPATSYSFYVTAVDNGGTETGPSNTVVVTTPSNTDVGRFKRRRYRY